MNRKTIGVYTGAFIVLAFFAFAPYLLLGKSLIFDSDTIHQHVNALMYLGRWLREIASGIVGGQGVVIPLWDFSIGYGSDILTTMHYYAFGDPLNLVSAFVPASGTEYLYGTLIIVRLYLAGIAFMFYCHKLSLPTSSYAISAITYVFCGWALVSSARHAYFLNPMIYLPLMLIGFERIFRKEGPAVFMAATFLAAISNFYFFYMLALAVALYALARFFGQKRPYRTKAFLQLFFKTLGAGIAGALMAAVILIPVVSLFLNTDRAHVELLHDPLYSWKYYLQLAPSFLNSLFDNNWTAIGFAPVTLFALALLFVTKGSRGLKAVFVILTVFMLIPDIGSLTNGFSYPTNRWIWAYAFFASLVVAKQWPAISQLAVSRRAALRCLIIFLVFGAILLVIMVPLSHYAFPDSSRASIASKQRVALVSYIIALAFAVVVLAYARSSRLSAAIPRLYQPLLVLITVVGIAFNGLSTAYISGHVSEHVKLGHVYGKIMKYPGTDIAQIQQDESEFSRYETSWVKTYNTSTITGAYGVQYYWSLGPSGISRYYESLGMSERRTAYLYNYLENRAPLYALACVKYYAGKPGTEPYGFEQVDLKLSHKQKNMVLFENKNVLPLGYTYGSYIAQNSYDSLSMLQRQEAMLHGAVVAQDYAASAASLCPEAQWTPNDRALEAAIACDEAVIDDDGSMRIDAADEATVVLKFHKVPNAEYYVSITNLQAERKNNPAIGHWGHTDERIQISVQSESRTTKMRYPTPYFRWSTGQHDFLPCVGYSADGIDEIQITLPGDTVYTMDGIQVYCQPMDGYEDLINQLKAEPLENEVVGTNTVSGTLSLTQNKILCLSIPYSTGWRAELDGQPQELMPTNTMFMGFAVPEGEHQIALYYETPGLRVGIVASVFGWLVFLGTVIYQRRKKHASAS